MGDEWEDVLNNLSTFEEVLRRLEEGEQHHASVTIKSSEVALMAKLLRATTVSIKYL